MPNPGFGNVPALELVSGSSVSSPSNSRLDAAGRVSGGVLTVQKDLVFKVPRGADPRAYNAMDVYYSQYFPMRGSVMDEDARMVFSGEAEITHWCDDGNYIVASLTYNSMRPVGADQDDDNDKDVDGKEITKDTPPWKLRPQEVRFNTLTQERPLTIAYNSNGELFRDGKAVNPVMNTVGEPFHVNGLYKYQQMSFSYYVQSSKWSSDKGWNYSNTINKSDITVCGMKIEDGTGLLQPISATLLTTYKQGSTKVKWKYWKIDVSIVIDKDRLTLSKTVLNVGDRAKHHPINTLGEIDSFYITAMNAGWFTTAPVIAAATYPQQIVTFHPFKYVGQDDQGRYLNVPDINRTVWCGWQQFIAYREGVLQIARSMGSRVVVPDPQCEQQHDIPLDKDGFVDFPAINAGTCYYRRFWQFPKLSWSSIGLPKKR